jgi:glycerol-3-phosphate dehydrogenase
LRRRPSRSGQYPTFQRVHGGLVADLETDRGEHAVRGQHGRRAGVEHEEAARAVRALRLARREAGLAEQRRLLIAERGAPFTVRASKGIHLVVPREKIDLDTGLILRTEKSVLFVIPWGRHWIVGTTDTEWDLDREHPAASQADVDYVLGHLNAGGKYTTYRVMAADAVDVAVEDLGRPAPPSWTDRLPIVGAAGYHELWDGRQSLAQRAGLPLSRIEHLLQRYGTAVEDILASIAERPELGELIPGTSEYLKAEAVYAVSHEGALHLEDVLTRRTRISIEERDRGVTAAPEVAALMAPLLGWDSHRQEREVTNYLARVEAERSAQAQPDDEAANASRLAAPALTIS